MENEESLSEKERDLERKEVPNSEAGVYSSFGWEKEKEVHRFRSIAKAVLVRDKSRNNYAQLCQLEEEYQDYRNQIQPVPEIDVLTAILLFLLLIVPGILYVEIKKQKKGEILEENEEVKERMDTIIQKAEALK
ncbi:MAG: hypothetical protein WCR16_03870 [Bacilli bacterium]